MSPSEQGAHQVVRRSTDPQTRQATRERLLRSAAREFSQIGFDQANINTIAEQAGLGKGTIYLYFPSKHDLFLELLQAIATRQLAVVRAALASKPTIQGQLEALWLAFVRLAMEDTEGFQVYMSALYGVNRAFQAEATALLREYISLLSSILAKAGHSKQPPQPELEIRALYLFSATESFVLAARVLGYTEKQLAAMAPSIATLLMYGLPGTHK
jgi:AcrR family transcriptional regulator